MNLKALQYELAAFAAERDLGTTHNPKNLAVALAAEAGALLARFKWMTDEQSWRLGAAAERERAADAMADVVLHTLRLADELGVDLEAAIAAKLEKNAKKYPAGRGTAQAETPALLPEPVAVPPRPEVAARVESMAVQEEIPGSGSPDRAGAPREFAPDDALADAIEARAEAVTSAEPRAAARSEHVGAEEVASADTADMASAEDTLELRAIEETPAEAVLAGEAAPPPPEDWTSRAVELHGAGGAPVVSSFTVAVEALVIDPAATAAAVAQGEAILIVPEDLVRADAGGLLSAPQSAGLIETPVPPPAPEAAREAPGRARRDDYPALDVETTKALARTLSKKVDAAKSDDPLLRELHDELETLRRTLYSAHPKRSWMAESLTTIRSLLEEAALHAIGDQLRAREHVREIDQLVGR